MGITLAGPDAPAVFTSLTARVLGPQVGLELPDMPRRDKSVGVLYVTNQRVLWVREGVAGTVLDAGDTASVPLAAVVQIDPHKWALFGSKTPRVRLLVSLDEAATPTTSPLYSVRSAAVTFAFRGAAADATQFAEALAAVRQCTHPEPRLPTTAAGGGAQLSPSASYPPPAADWACGRCTLVNASDSLVCVACAAHPPAPQSLWRCPRCTLMNQPLATVCEACGSMLVSEPVSAAYASAVLAQPPSPFPPAAAPDLTAVGISGLLRREEQKEQRREDDMEQAFSDLSALTDKARQMVDMAELLRERIRRERLESGAAASSLGGMDQEMEDLLLDVGIVNPVTKESAGSLYHRQLSRQLADWLIAVLERRGGVMAAPEIYCLFNRARGTELVSPEDLIQACRLWPKLGLPLCLDRFASGVLVVKSHAFSDDQVCTKLAELVSRADPVCGLGKGASVGDTATALGIPLALAQSYLLMAEERGVLCRDDGPRGCIFYTNMFVD